MSIPDEVLYCNHGRAVNECVASHERCIPLAPPVRRVLWQGANCGQVVFRPSHACRGAGLRGQVRNEWR